MLRGRDHTRIGVTSAVAEGCAAIALSRGGAPKSYRYRDPNEDAALFAFVDVRQRVVFVPGNRKAREQGIAVVSAFELDVSAEDDVHVRQPGEFLGLIHLMGPAGFDIHLLERDEIGFLMGDHAGDALEVQLPIHAFAVMDIVAQYAESKRISTAGFKEVAPACLPGRKMIGGGAAIRSLADQDRVGLTMARVDALGGLWKSQGDLNRNFDSLFEQIAFGGFPWVALAPVAVAHLAMGGRRGRRAWAGYLVFGWAAIAWAMGAQP